MAHGSAGIDAARAEGGLAGRIKRLGLTLAAGITFLRLYTQPTEARELPATIRLQPAW